MSANAETQTPQQPVKKSGKRKRLLLLLTLLFIIIAVAIGILLVFGTASFRRNR